MDSLMVLFTLLVVREATGHGYMIDPPGRSTMWRVGFNTPKNYDDNALNCGGYMAEWKDGKRLCGICGDPFRDPQPRPNEAGGKYGTGIIGKTYVEGSTITIETKLTANHLGYFEIRVCPNNNPKKIATQECLDQHVLELAEGSGTKYIVGSKTGKNSYKVKLPKGLTCTQCVLQWRYHGGNHWGTDANHKSGTGLGNQEEFYACADVAISPAKAAGASQVE